MDLTGAILLAGIGLVIGFLVGVLVFSLRKDTNPEAASRERVLSDSENDIRVWREGKERPAGAGKERPGNKNKISRSGSQCLRIPFGQPEIPDGKL